MKVSTWLWMYSRKTLINKQPMHWMMITDIMDKNIDMAPPDLMESITISFSVEFKVLSTIVRTMDHKI